ncbi:hypothetical protein C7G83_02430 [Siccibacter turicensis]|uniref:Uncharacterized protein n=1 Tax=Siccibacter turicensis TaxID=357233 RepID=A0A2P8VPY9_9ENTR|nr:hypothetical protein C7G83_02430 [Siccibacter turicensis]
MPHLSAGISKAVNQEGSESHPIKNPSTLNQNGGVDGLHKLGTSKKSSGTNSDWRPGKKFAGCEK